MTRDNFLKLYKIDFQTSPLETFSNSNLQESVSVAKVQSIYEARKTSRRLILAISSPYYKWSTIVFSFFKNVSSSASLSFNFCLFKQTIQILQEINVKKCPSSIRYRNLNSQPSDYEKPGLLPNGLQLLFTNLLSLWLKILPIVGL